MPARFTSHPLWLVGFRPFFALACLSGATLPLAWVLMLGGTLPPPTTLATTPQQWHAHEMFFGFGWAMLGGFLLTSTKNWVGIRGHHGGTLIFLVAAWIFERAGMLCGGAWPAVLLALSSYLYLAAIVGLLLGTLIVHRETDSYRDNVYFWLALPLFLPAKWLLLSPEYFATGRNMTLALFRLTFLIMLERTLVQFMKNAFQLTLKRIAALDHAIKSLALALVFAPFLPDALGAAASGVLALLLLGRFSMWQPLRALTRIDVGIMFLGAAAIIAQLGFEALGQGPAWVGSVSVHLFTVGAMGLIVPAMIVRISRGHTGRKVVFETLDKVVLWVMLAGLALRIVAPQLAPGAYPVWIHLAATCWLAGFGLLGCRYVPWLLRPRADGKEH
jgi:uncharacterized protein involved in response to NO